MTLDLRFDPKAPASEAAAVALIQLARQVEILFDTKRAAELLNRFSPILRVGDATQGWREPEATETLK